MQSVLPMPRPGEPDSVSTLRSKLSSDHSIAAAAFLATSLHDLTAIMPRLLDLLGGEA